MDKEDLKLDSFFTTDGKDVWKITEFCMEPTCKLVNIETKEESSFGLSGLTSAKFHRILMPVMAVKNIKDK